MKGFYKSKDTNTWNQGARSTWGKSVHSRRTRQKERFQVSEQVMKTPSENRQKTGAVALHTKEEVPRVPIVRGKPTTATRALCFASQVSGGGGHLAVMN